MKNSDEKSNLQQVKLKDPLSKQGPLADKIKLEQLSKVDAAQGKCNTVLQSKQDKFYEQTGGNPSQTLSSSSEEFSSPVKKATFIHNRNVNQESNISVNLKVYSEDIRKIKQCIQQNMNDSNHNFPTEKMVKYDNNKSKSNTVDDGSKPKKPGRLPIYIQMLKRIFLQVFIENDFFGFIGINLLIIFAIIIMQYYRNRL